MCCITTFPHSVSCLHEAGLPEGKNIHKSLQPLVMFTQSVLEHFQLMNLERFLAFMVFLKKLDKAEHRTHLKGAPYLR